MRKGEKLVWREGTKKYSGWRMLSEHPDAIDVDDAGVDVDVSSDQNVVTLIPLHDFGVVDGQDALGLVDDKHRLRALHQTLGRTVDIAQG